MQDAHEESKAVTKASAMKGKFASNFLCGSLMSKWLARSDRWVLLIWEVNQVAAIQNCDEKYGCWHHAHWLIILFLPLCSSSIYFRIYAWVLLESDYIWGFLTFYGLKFGALNSIREWWSLSALLYKKALMVYVWLIYNETRRLYYFNCFFYTRELLVLLLTYCFPLSMISIFFSSQNRNLLCYLIIRKEGPF